MAVPLTSPSARAPASATGARERLLEAAYELFASRGVRAVGIDTIIQRSGVARQTMYRHFDSKQALVLAFLDRRAQLWTRDWLRMTVERTATEPRARLLAIFDAFDEWFHQPGFEGCSFINVMLEFPDRDDPLHQACAAHLAEIRSFVAAVAREAGIADADRFAHDWHLLMKGSIVAAAEGDLDAARRARLIGTGLLAAASLADETASA